MLTIPAWANCRCRPSGARRTSRSRPAVNAAVRRAETLADRVHNYKSHFGRLSSLSEGDEVRFTSQDGAEAVYTVEGTAQVSPEEPEALREGGCPLVLYTCTPGGKARVVVYCQKNSKRRVTVRWDSDPPFMRKLLRYRS